MKEFWKQYRATRYEVSTLGRVRISPKKDNRGRTVEPEVVLKNQKRRSNGRYYVSMVLNGKKTTKPVHQLVADVFLEKPEGATIIEFKDGNSSDPSRKNLKWKVPDKKKKSNKELASKKYKRGTDHWSNQKRENPLEDWEVEDIRKSKTEVSMLATHYGLSRTHIYRIKNGQSRALPTPYKNSVLEQQKENDKA